VPAFSTTAYTRDVAVQNKALQTSFLPLSTVASSEEELIQGAETLRAQKGAHLEDKDSIMWIIKPSCANQGTGIVMCRVSELEEVARNMWRDSNGMQQPRCANKGYVRKRRKHTDTQEGHSRAVDRLKPGDQVRFSVYASGLCNICILLVSLC
jgi:hypothetical protein